jgi:hypothetical protein
MIYIDIDNVCIDFTGTLERYFGIKLKPNDFETFHWKSADYLYCERCEDVCQFPAPQEFYAKAELTPWAVNLIETIHVSNSMQRFATKDYASIKSKALQRLIHSFHTVAEFQNKSLLCKHPCDLLLDDNPAECEAWRAKGGLAFWFDNSKPDIFEQFLKWWRLER